MRRSPKILTAGGKHVSLVRELTKFKVQYGLRYNTFTNGTIIEDIMLGSRHEVVTKNVFKPTSRGGVSALVKSEFVSTHPMINLCAFSDDRMYNK